MSRAAVLDWLLEPENPSARYLTLRHLLGWDEQDEQVIAARKAIPGFYAVRAILDAQYPAGYWVKPDRGYSPRYKATIWQLIFLADLGMPRTPAVAQACEYVLQNTVHAGYGLFSAHKHSTGVYPCLNGSLMRALLYFGYDDHSTVQALVQAMIDWVQVVGFACPRNSIQVRKKNSWQPCIWGCVQVLRGFAALSKRALSKRALGKKDLLKDKWSETGRLDAMHQVVEQGINLVCAHNLVQNQQPMLVETSSHWLQLGFPLGDHCDLLEALLALAEWNAIQGLDQAVQFIVDKRNREGRWLLEYTPARSWASFGSIGQPNKWVTLRALDVIERTR